MPDRPDDGHHSEPGDDRDLFDELTDDLDVEGVEQAERWERGREWLAAIRQPFDQDDGEPYIARSPCPRCHTTDALLVERNNQFTVRCRNCNRHLYNAPRSEAVQRQPTVKTLRRGIKPGQQARIMDRDAGRCVLCGSDEELTIGHLLAIEDGAVLGASVADLYSDANLAAMCRACNLGLPHGPSSVNPRTYAVIMWRLVQRENLRRHGE